MRLIKTLMQNERIRLKQLSLCALVFFTSYGMIHYANKNIEPSLQQEATALLALISCIASLLWAVTLQLLSIAAKTHLFERD